MSAHATDPEEAATDATGRWGRTTTKGDGTFRLDGLGDHPFLVAAGGGDTPWVSAAVERGVVVGRTDLVLRVLRGVAFSGRLVDPAGNPLASPHLQVRPRPGRLGATQATTVGPDGRFSFEGAAPGTVEIYVGQGDGGYVLGPFEAPAEDVEVVLVR